MARPASPPPIDVRLFAYSGGIPDLPGSDQLDWSFEVQGGPIGLVIEQPTIVICHAQGENAYELWIDWMMDRLAEAPKRPLGLLFVSGDPNAAHYSVKRVMDDRVHAVRIAGGDFEQEKKQLTRHIKVLGHALPSGAVRTPSDVTVREALDSFIHWIWDRTFVPPIEQFEKVWDPITREDSKVSDEVMEFVQSAIAVVTARLLPADQASKLRAGFWVKDWGEPEMLNTFRQGDVRHFATYYPLDVKRRSLRHSWLRHRIQIPLKEAEKKDSSPEREAQIRSELEATWVQLEPKLNEFLDFAMATAHTDPFPRAAVYLRYSEDLMIKVALKRIRDKDPAQRLREILPDVLERATQQLKEIPIEVKRAQAVEEARYEMQAFKRALAARLPIDRLKAHADRLDNALDLARVVPAGGGE